MDFRHPLYKQMLEETLTQCQEETFRAESYFLSHPDPKVSAIAVNLASDKYHLSKYHHKFQKIEEESEKLMEIVPYVVLALKDATLREQISQINLAIKKMQEENNLEEIEEQIKRLSGLREKQKIIAKHLGERIILKI